jgi:hypothetical protein
MSSLRSKVFPLLVMSLLVGACTKTVTTPPPPEPTPTTGVLNFQNNSMYTIQFIYASVCGSPNWGLDRMPNGQVISPTRSQGISLSPGCWDARVVTTGGLSAQWSAVTIVAGGSVTLSVSNFVRAE